MGLKNDWTIAHFLYYLSAFMIFGLIVETITVHLPDIYGQKTLHAINGIDPPIAIDSDYFGLNKKRVTFEDGSVFSLGSKVFAYPMYISSDSNPSGRSLLIVVRLLKLFSLLLFYMMLNFILRSLTQKNPFEPRNSMRLFTMGVALLSIDIFHFLQATFLSKSFNSELENHEIFFEAGFINSQGSIYFGLAIILLGFVFKEATRIHEELKLTV